MQQSNWAFQATCARAPSTFLFRLVRSPVRSHDYVRNGSLRPQELCSHIEFFRRGLDRQMER